MGTKALMEQTCFNQHCMGIYTVLQGGYSQERKIKIPDLQNIRSLLKRELQTITFS